MNLNEQGKSYEVSNEEYEYLYLKNYVMPDGKTLDDLDHIEIGTIDGILEFKLWFKGHKTGLWNVTAAYTPEQHKVAIGELENFFGEAKVMPNKI